MEINLAKGYNVFYCQTQNLPWENRWECYVNNNKCQEESGKATCHYLNYFLKYFLLRRYKMPKQVMVMWGVPSTSSACADTEARCGLWKSNLGISQQFPNRWAWKAIPGTWRTWNPRDLAPRIARFCVQHWPGFGWRPGPLVSATVQWPTRGGFGVCD